MYHVYAEEGLQVGKQILGTSTGVGETPAEDHPQIVETKSYLVVAANAANERNTTEGQQSNRGRFGDKKLDFSDPDVIISMTMIR